MNYHESSLFVLRRCIWVGRTTRADLMQAFGVPSATATRTLSYAVSHYPLTLRQKPKWVESIPHAAIPTPASAGVLLRLLGENPYQFAVTGLKPSELNVVITRLKHDVALSVDNAVLTLLLRATIHSTRIDIRYVGLRLGESARWRSVVPVALNYLQNQWRLMAHDLESTDFPLKSFVIPRILDAQLTTEKRPRGLRLQTGDIAQRVYKIRLNSRMTTDQKIAIQRELGINQNDEITLADNVLFDFRKTYMENEIKADANIVWPLVVELQRAG